MATRNRNRTQRKNKNKNRSRRNKQGGGGMSCSDAQAIMNGTKPGSKLFAGVKIRSECKKGNNGRVLGGENTSGTVAPNQKWTMATRSRRNRKHRGGDNSCNIAKAAANAASGVKKMKLMIEAKQACSGGAKTVAPNKRWYNARAREGEQGVWNGSMSPTGSKVVPVKSCGTSGQNPDGTCKVGSEATSYNYVA